MVHMAGASCGKRLHAEDELAGRTAREGKGRRGKFNRCLPQSLDLSPRFLAFSFSAAAFLENAVKEPCS
jgi:hypothetical protein